MVGPRSLDLRLQQEERLGLFLDSGRLSLCQW